MSVLVRIKRALTHLNEDITGDHIQNFGSTYNELVAEYGYLLGDLSKDSYIDVGLYEFSKTLQVEEAAKKTVRFKDHEAVDDEATQMRNELMGTFN